VPMPPVPPVTSAIFWVIFSLLVSLVICTQVVMRTARRT
jgi:hypothetical protein